MRIAASLDARSPHVHFELADALLAEAKQNPFPTLTNWIEATEAVKVGLSIVPDDERGLALSREVAAQRALALS